MCLFRMCSCTVEAGWNCDSHKDKNWTGFGSVLFKGMFVLIDRFFRPKYYTRKRL